MSVETPILLLVFNRADTTKQVLAALRTVRPKYLYVAADGPRAAKEGEKEKCEEVRALFNTIDWPCELKTNFRDTNLGCGHGPAEAISWFFKNVEQGIILEDDCVPHPTFFSYCAELLEKYKNNEKIMHISGNNFLNKNYAGNDSYYFNKYLTAWGWATWRRAWQHYDYKVGFLDAFLQSQQFKNLPLNHKQEQYWRNIAELVRQGQRADIWDYQWLLTCWMQDGLAITPAVNLVTNIGFGADATHTVNDSKAGYVKSEAIDKIIHPKQIIRNKKVDMDTFNTYFEPSQHLNKLRVGMYKVLPKPIMLILKFVRRKFFPNIK